MSVPKRYLEDGPSRARDLLSKAKSTPPMPAAVHAATAASVAKLASTKATKLLLLKWILGTLAAGGIVAGVLWVAGAEAPPPAEGGQVEGAAVEDTAERGAAPVAPGEGPDDVVREELVGEPPPPQVERSAVSAAPGRVGAAVEGTRAEEPQAEEPRAEEPRAEEPQAEEPQHESSEDVPDEGPSTDTLAAEVALLERARRGLSEDPAAALRSAQEHRRVFPHGQFAAAAELVEIDALLRLGRRPEAEEKARAMAERRPSSLYRDRLSTLVGEEALR